MERHVRAELIKRKSRYGTYFVGCSNYPKCNYMENLQGERIVPKAKKTAEKKTTAKKATTRKTTTKTTKTTTRKRTKKS